MINNWRKEIVQFSIMGMRFVRDITLVFAGVDIALNYNAEGILNLSAIIALLLAVFGIYGFMTYGINKFEKHLNK